ncbi:unnamed protein product [Durusdinium trenchii]|uniref:Uncharacterized protein n=1 Tax=Durusdinium trenchii TaxID=1381693 RepID=A0ABP0K145_9DINO
MIAEEDGTSKWYNDNHFGDFGDLDMGGPWTGLTLFSKPEEEVFDPLPSADTEADTSARAPRSLPVPKEPTAQERAEHELTHLPFRSWCKICVESKSRQDHSKKLRLKQPVLQCDYSFITDPETKDHVTLLNVRDVLSGLALSCVVPCKGHSVYAEGELRRFVLETGRTFGTLQADPEPALLTVVQTMTSELGGLSLRKSPTEWKQAQGAVGNAQQLLYAQVRALRQDFASRYGFKLSVTSPLFAWLVKHAQFLLNNFSVRSDGLTPYERRWSRRYNSELCKFGEIVMCRLPGKHSKAEPSWVQAIWLGRDTSADMRLIGTTSGVLKTRSIRRLPVSEQVDQRMAEDFKASPWDPKGRGEDTDVLILPPPPAEIASGAPVTPSRVADAPSTAFETSAPSHGTKRTSEDIELDDVDEPANLFQRVGPSTSDLKRSAPDTVPGAERNFSGLELFLKMMIHFLFLCLTVASVTTKHGLDVPIEPNVDREEELQALRAADPVLWYDTEFDREQEIAGMNKEMTSIKNFEVYEEVLTSECTSEQLQNAISTKWVKRPKGGEVKCRVCVRGFDQEVDPDDTYASTPSLITLRLLLTLAIAFDCFVIAGIVAIKKVAGTLNTSDVMTKYITKEAPEYDSYGSLHPGFEEWSTSETMPPKMAKALPRIPPLSWRNFQTHEEVQQQQRLQDQLQAQRMNRGLDFSSSPDLQTSVMPPYDNPHFILQLNPEHFLHSFWNKESEVMMNTPEEQLLYKMVDEFPLQRPQGPASLLAWTLTGHFYILLGMHDLAFIGLFRALCGYDFSGWS